MFDVALPMLMGALSEKNDVLGRRVGGSTSLDRLLAAKLSPLNPKITARWFGARMFTMLKTSDD